MAKILEKKGERETSGRKRALLQDPAPSSNSSRYLLLSSLSYSVSAFLFVPLAPATKCSSPPVLRSNSPGKAI